MTRFSRLAPDQLAEVPARGRAGRAGAASTSAGHPRSGRGHPQVIFWKYLFVPIYRRLPWRVKHFVILAMPGSHRRQLGPVILPWTSHYALGRTACPSGTAR